MSWIPLDKVGSESWYACISQNRSIWLIVFYNWWQVIIPESCSRAFVVAVERNHLIYEICTEIGCEFIDLFILFGVVAMSILFNISNSNVSGRCCLSLVAIVLLIDNHGWTAHYSTCRICKIPKYYPSTWNASNRLYIISIDKLTLIYLGSNWDSWLSVFVSTWRMAISFFVPWTLRLESLPCLHLGLFLIYEGNDDKYYEFIWLHFLWLIIIFELFNYNLIKLYT